MIEAILVARLISVVPDFVDLPPNVQISTYRHAVRLAPIVLRAHRLERKHRVATFTVRRLWEESSFRLDRVGLHGERGPGQILPGTGAWLCSDLNWSHNATENIRCMLRVTDHYGRRCDDLTAGYTTGNCPPKKRNANQGETDGHLRK